MVIIGLSLKEKWEIQILTTIKEKKKKKKITWRAKIHIEWICWVNSDLTFGLEQFNITCLNDRISFA